MYILCHWDYSHGTTEVMGKSDAWFPTQRYSRKALLQSMLRLHLSRKARWASSTRFRAIGADAAAARLHPLSALLGLEDRGRPQGACATRVRWCQKWGVHEGPCDMISSIRSERRAADKTHPFDRLSVCHDGQDDGLASAFDD